MPVVSFAGSVCKNNIFEFKGKLELLIIAVSAINITVAVTGD